MTDVQLLAAAPRSQPGQPDRAAAEHPSLSAPLQFRPMLAGDAVLLELQPSQRLEIGMTNGRYSLDEGEFLVDAGPAWTAYRGSRIVGIAGFRVLFAAAGHPGQPARGGHALAWASLSADVGRDHLAITRFARWEVENAPFRRIEAVVDRDSKQAMKWAALVGLTAAHIMRGYGPEGADHILFERVKTGGRS